MGLIVGFVQSSFIAGSITADFDGLRIKTRQDLQRDVMLFTSLAKPNETDYVLSNKTLKFLFLFFFHG